MVFYSASLVKFLVRFCLSVSLGFVSVPASATTVPQVVADLPATHSLVSMIMGELGEPELLLRGAIDPHHHTMRPSAAGMLESSDLVVWLHPELAPWLPMAVANLAPAASSLRLMDVPGTVILDARTGHHLKSTGLNGAGQQAPQVIDPHGWLDPVNAGVWLVSISRILQELDPANAAVYRKNMEAATLQLENLTGQLAAQLASIPRIRYLVAHDSYQYFEQRFGFVSLAAIAASDAAIPGPRRLHSLRKLAQEHQPLCIFSEPAANQKRLAALFEGVEAQVVQLDPVGVSFAPGPELYLELLQHLVDSMSTCPYG